MGFLDCIFPKKCVACGKIGSYLCPNCFSFLSFDTKEICAVCNKPAISGLTHPRCLGRFTIDGIFSSICYKGVAKKLIYKFKYDPYLTGLKNLLIDLFYEGIIQKEEFDNIYKEKPLLVPIPLHSSKLRTRGYNQAKILTIGLAKKLNLQTFNLLERIKKTPTQVGLPREKRLKNLRGAFAAKSEKRPIRQAQGKQAISNKTVFLVDDVFTTGSTLLEAGKALKRNGAKKVFGLTLASQ